MKIIPVASIERHSRRTRLQILIMAIIAATSCVLSQAQTYTIGGAVNGLGGSTGMQLRLDSTFACLQNDHYFKLGGGSQTSACFANESKCCSGSIKSAATDGASTVTCTCGTAAPPRQEEVTLLAATSEIVTVPAGATSFRFETELSPTSPYVVSVATLPQNPRLKCGIGNSSGLVANVDVSNVKANCVDQIFDDNFDPSLIIVPPGF